MGRGSGMLDDFNLAEPQPGEFVLILDETLQRLEQVHPKWAQVVVMRYFGGMTQNEVAGRWKSASRRWPATGPPPSSGWRKQLMLLPKYRRQILRADRSVHREGFTMNGDRSLPGRTTTSGRAEWGIVILFGAGEAGRPCLYAPFPPFGKSARKRSSLRNSSLL